MLHKQRNIFLCEKFVKIIMPNDPRTVLINRRRLSPFKQLSYRRKRELKRFIYCAFCCCCLVCFILLLLCCSLCFLFIFVHILLDVHVCACVCVHGVCCALQIVSFDNSYRPINSIIIIIVIIIIIMCCVSFPFFKFCQHFDMNKVSNREIQV